MGLDDVTDVAGRIVRRGRRVPARRADRPLDPTLDDASRRQHDALLAAVGAETPGWSDADRRLAAALLDVLWASGATSTWPWTGASNATRRSAARPG